MKQRSEEKKREKIEKVYLVTETPLPGFRNTIGCSEKCRTPSEKYFNNLYGSKGVFFFMGARGRFERVHVGSCSLCVTFYRGYVGCCKFRVGYFRLYACCAEATWTVVASINAVKSLCGLSHPLCALLQHLYMLQTCYVGCYGLCM